MTSKSIFPKLLHSQKLQILVQLILFINFNLNKFLDANISPNPSTINSNSQYSFQISPSYRILNTDSIVITFPSQVKLSSGSRTCTASSASDTTLAITLCNALNNTLAVKIRSTLSTVTDFITEIAITNGIINPPSTYADMLNIQILDQAGNIKEGNNLISITYTAAVLKNVQMFSSSNVSGAVSNITIAFTPDQSILKGSTILFQFPYFNANSGSSSYISMIPGVPATSLVVVSGINIASTISMTDTSITLSNIFPSTNSDTSTQISFTIVNILNPPSTAPLSGYYITTGGSNYQIEISPPLTLQVSKPSIITRFAITSTNSLVNQMTSLNFLFMTSNFIPLGAVLELIFPNDLPISQLTLNSINGITKIQPIVSYSINNQAVRMTNAIASYYTSQDFHYFRQSSKPTSTFLFNVYTPNNYLMYSLNFPVNYTATPGSFSNITVCPASNGINQMTNYTFSFTNLDPIVAGGYLVVEFPPEIFLGNFFKTSCAGHLNIQQEISSNANCAVTNPNNQNSILTISNGFPATLPSNSLLSFSVQNVTNNFCAGTSSSFTIGSYTSDGYSIDNNSQNIVVSFSSGALISPQISRVNNINYDVTTYNFSFQISNFLPVNSSIVITFPDDLEEIEVIDQNSLMSNCSLTTGNNAVISNSCNFVLNGEIQTVTLSSINQYVLPANTSINVGLNSIRNPRSIKPSDSFTIQTQSSTGCPIDENFNNIIISDSQPALTSYVSVTPISFLNGDTTQYIFTFTPTVMINSTDVLEITFPSVISLGNNISVQGLGDLSNMSYTLTQAQNNQKILSISLSISNACNCIESGGNLNFTLEVNNVINPISLKPTDTFYFKFLTYDSYEIEEWDSTDNPIVLTMLTPNILQQASVVPLLNERVTVSDYTFAFLPFNIIPKGGAILIILPNEIFVVDGSCVNIIGLSNNITCTYNSTLRKITLSGGFRVKDFTPSLIQFSIKGLNNTLSGNNTTTGSFQIFTQDSYGFTIDEKINGLNVTFTCSFLCATCEVDNLTCSSCFAYGQFPYLLNGNCFSACPNGYAIDVSMTKCVACNPTCLTCSENSKDSCITCDVNSSYPYFMSSSNTCVSQCPAGYFQGNNLCNLCSVPCKTCNSATSCLSCNDISVNNPYYFYYATAAACLSNCPSGITVRSGNFCLDCDTNCGTCSQTTTTCTSCSAGKILLNTTCILAGDCPSDHYVDSTRSKCLACDPNCLICGGANYNTCKLCKEGFVLNSNNICQPPSTSCNIGYYLDQASLCDKCVPECLSCVNMDDRCTGCNSGLVLQGNLCQSQCNQGFFPTNVNINSTGVSTVSCSQCNSECNTCSNSANFCTSCFLGQILYNNTCLNVCPKGYFNNPISANQNICQKCLLTNCDVCSVGSTCLTCSNYFFLYNGQCNTDCPTNYSKDYINRICVENSNNILNMQHSKSFTLSGTYLIFLILALGVIIPCNIMAKRSHDDTYFCGSTIAMIGLLHIFQFYFYLSHVFSYGVEIYFIILAYCLVMKIFLNNFFIIVYEFYINTDKEFKYWKSSHKYISFLFFFLAYLFDYKIIRLFYARWCSLKIFKPKFENFNLIHIPYRKLMIVEILLVLIPMNIVTIFILINVNYSEALWSCALENFLLCSLILVISIIDLNVNKKLNEDFYNQKKCHPEIIPFDVANDKIRNNKIGINKQFDFNEAGNLIENDKGKGVRKSYGVGVNSFLKRVKNFSGNKILQRNKSKGKGKNDLEIEDNNIDNNNSKSNKFFGDKIKIHGENNKQSFNNIESFENSINKDMVSSTRKKFRSNSSENLQKSQINNAFTDPIPINHKQNIFKKNGQKKSFSSEKISNNENETDRNIRFHTDYTGDNPFTNRLNTRERVDTNILNHARIFTIQNDDNIYSKLSAGIHSLFKSFSNSANNKLSREDYETLDENEDDNRLRKEISQFNFNSNSDEGRNKIVTGHPFNNMTVNVSTPNFSHDVEKSFASNALLNNKMVIER